MSDDTTSVLVVLTVPRPWQRLSVREIERKLRRQPELLPMLAKEVKRWGDSGVIDLTGLQRFIDDRTGGRP